MTSQDPVTSKSHTFQDHHGDVRSRECRAGGPLPVSWLFSDCSPAFPCLTVSFFLSFLIFWDSEVSVSFSCLTSLLFVLVHGHFCSVVVGFNDFPAPFPSSQYVIPLLRKIHKHDECWLQGDFFVTCTVWRNESATLTQVCQNTSVRRLQVCFRAGSAGGQQANSSESTLPRRRTTTRSPTVRLNSKLSKATLTSRTERSGDRILGWTAAPSL